MSLQLVSPVVSEPVRRFSTDALVDEISSLDRPVFRHNFTGDFCLISQDGVPDLFPVPTVVGPPTQHTLVSDDADRVEVNRIAVVHSEHDLRRHIARRATQLIGK